MATTINPLTVVYMVGCLFLVPLSDACEFQLGNLVVKDGRKVVLSKDITQSLTL